MKRTFIFVVSHPFLGNLATGAWQTLGTFCAQVLVATSTVISTVMTVFLVLFILYANSWLFGLARIGVFYEK